MQKYTVLYDAIPLIFSDNVPSWYKDLVKSLNHDDYYFAISKSARDDFIKHVPVIDPKKIKVALLGANNEKFYPVADVKKISDTKRKYNIPMDKKYILSLCSLEPRKNLIRTATAFIKFIEKHHINDFVFVLGGNAWAKFIQKMESEIPDFVKYRDKIIRAGYIDDADLAPLYSGAEFFVYTSKYEGFGLPPLEAMQCGRAVITSNNSSLPEVVGDAGIMIDFDSLDQHIAAFEKLYFDSDLRREYEQKSLKRVSEFSWKKCADTIVMEIQKNQKN